MFRFGQAYGTILGVIGALASVLPFISMIMTSFKSYGSLITGASNGLEASLLRLGANYRF